MYQNENFSFIGLKCYDWCKIRAFKWSWELDFIFMLQEFIGETLWAEFYTLKFEVNRWFHRARKVPVQNMQLIQHRIKTWELWEVVINLNEKDWFPLLKGQDRQSTMSR